VKSGAAHEGDLLARAHELEGLKKAATTAHEARLAAQQLAEQLAKANAQLQAQARARGGAFGWVRIEVAS
jgi:ribosomal protein L9